MLPSLYSSQILLRQILAFRRTKSDAHIVIFNRKAQVTVLTEGLLQRREICEGSVDELYEHGMLGGAIEKDRPPTWSILCNVLGRVE
jgi:hypothetical protein